MDNRAAGMTAEERATQFFDACHHRVIRNAGVCQECFEKALRAHANSALEEVAKMAENYQVGCNCAAVDIGVGIQHEPGCGLSNQREIAAAIRALREEGSP